MTGGPLPLLTGPFPFGFANSNLALYIMIGLMALTIIVWFLINRLY